jgi:hypothetical protein
MKIESKRALVQMTYDALAQGGRFIVYQLTNELRRHATSFGCAESEYFLRNIPPMFITIFEKTQTHTDAPESGLTEAAARIGAPPSRLRKRT